MNLLRGVKNGMFNPEDIQPLLYNTAYSVHAVAGESLGDGVINIESLCLSISNGQLITWLSPLEITVQEICDWTTGNSNILVCVIGGYAAYNSNSNITVSGTNLNEFSLPASEECFTIDVGQAFGTTFSYFAIDELGCEAMADFTSTCEKLAVELLTFNGINRKDHNLVQWSFGSTTDHGYVVLEKSDNGVDFHDIHTVHGPENSTTINHYEYQDVHHSLNAFYRLRIVDVYGTIQYSNVIYLEANNEIPELVINQVGHQEYLLIGNQVESVQELYLFGLDGSNKAITIQNGRFSTHQFTPGLYFVSMQIANHQLTIPLYIMD